MTATGALEPGGLPQGSPAGAKAVRGRLVTIESLRGLAALLVLTQHAASSAGVIEGRDGGMWIATGVAVPIFFVISGFVLYIPFSRWLAGTSPRPSIRRFGLRRALRAFPAYWIALTVLTVYPGLPDMRLKTAVIYYGFGQVYLPGKVFGGIGPAWSLCVEVTFYAFVVALPLLIARRSRRPAATEVPVMLGLLAAVVVMHVAAARTASGEAYFHFTHTLPGTLDWFLIGMLAATVVSGTAPGWLRRSVEAMQRHPWRCWGVALALMVPHGLNESAYQAGWAIQPQQPLLGHLLATVECVLITIPVCAGLVATPGAQRLLSAPPLVWLGLCSYGIYLWHRPIVQALYDNRLAWGLPTGDVVWLSVIAAAVTIPIAAVRWYLVERPLIEVRRGSRS